MHLFFDSKGKQKINAVEVTIAKNESQNMFIYIVIQGMSKLHKCWFRALWDTKIKSLGVVQIIKKIISQFHK